MEFEFSSRFIKQGAELSGIQSVWVGLCRDLLAAEFGPQNLVRLDPNETGIDILDRDKNIAFRCLALDEPAADTLTVEQATSSLQIALRQRQKLGWKKYVFATNASYSPEAIDAIVRTLPAPEQTSDVEFLDTPCWGALSAKHGQVVRVWFDYRVTLSQEDIVKAFRAANYYDDYVTEYETRIKAADYRLVLKNNRTPLELDIPFAPTLTIENLLDVGLQLFAVDLTSTRFPELGTSASLETSIIHRDRTQSFSKTLSDIGAPSGGELQLWIKVIWRTESAPPHNLLQELLKSSDSTSVPFVVHRLSYRATDFSAKYFRTPEIAKTLTRPADAAEATIERKVFSVRSAMWRKVAALLPVGQPSARGTAERSRTPVRLGATAPSTVKTGSSFRARFVAYHPDLEPHIVKQLEEAVPGGQHRLDQARPTWELGTKVVVHAYGTGFAVDPEFDEFQWGGEKHILDFRVKQSDEKAGSRDLKFDVYVESTRIGRVWLEVTVGPSTDGRKNTVITSTPATAFASYASKDRSRVLDRVASLEIHTGISVFLDCVSMRPNDKWRTLLLEMIQRSDQLLLFWSKAARDSTWVSEEWRYAFSTKGISGIEVHPLDTWDQAPLPPELGDLVHGGDPIMVIRAHEERILER